MVAGLLPVVQSGVIVAVGTVVQVAVAVPVPTRRVRVGDEGALAASAGVVGVDGVGTAVIPVQSVRRQ